MLVLDTDHLSEIDLGSARGRELSERLKSSEQDVVTTIVSVEEQLRGWLAMINSQLDPLKQIEPYSRLQGRFHFFSKWKILPFDEPSARLFSQMRAGRSRIGTMDLKIAAIARAIGAVLLTANFSDFGRLEGLKVECWI